MKRNWLENQQYQTILRLTHTIAFEFNPWTGEHFVSPFVSEILAGNYDSRQLSRVMLEDGVLYPEDTHKMIAFRDHILEGKCGNENILMRLKTIAGDFRWYRMSVCISDMEDNSKPTVVGTITDADDETKLRQKLRKLALHDEVTGIYNKTAFYIETKRLLNAGENRRYSLILFDVKRFKMVNELFGMKAGDKLLRFIAEAAASCIGAHEAYGRIRDDVFCLCVSRSDDEILRLIDKLRAEVAKTFMSLSLTISIGIYRVDEPSLPISVMVDKASLALSTVKGNAASGVAYYSQELSNELAREQKIIGEVQDGICTGQFKVFYQPKHLIEGGGDIGAEALVRWIHPQKGMIPPGDFIDLFEQNGLITGLDEYVWETVCKTLRGWLDKGYSPHPVSVNVSRVHLYDPKLCDKFIRLTEKYNISPALLELELTESAYVENPHLNELMYTLQSKGFTFSMDDFGSGYSSLNMLRSIPVDVLKLDLHFLSFTDEEPSGKIIMESVIQMAQRLNIPIIAEGVETAGQVEFLRGAGCTMAQGFYYSRPMPCDEYENRYLRGEGAGDSGVTFNQSFAKSL